MHRDGLARITGGLFQSAPGREAGRCPGEDGGTLLQVKFQSAPGREAGRCLESGP